ncbi:MAG: MATE family efflux transporter [Spirochaetota bacterium]
MSSAEASPVPPPVATSAMLRRLLNIAFPMIVSQASETVMQFVDRLFLSRVGKLHLSAAMAGGLVTFTVASIFVGIAGYVNAIVAQYYGADRRENCAKAAAQSVYFSLMAVPVLLVIALVVPRFFAWIGHDPGQVPLESAYAQWLIAGAVVLLVRHALTGFFLGIGRTRIVMLSNIAAMLVNVPLNYVLIFGRLGFPELGIVGAAIGTLGGGFTGTAILLAAYLSKRIDREYGTRSSWAFDPELFARLLRFGSPAGVEIFLNVLAFNLFVQLMHGYGADVAAATTITFNWDIVAFIPMLGLGVATTAVVGQYIGADDTEGARKSALLALRIGWIYSGSMMVLFLVAAPSLVGLFSAGFADTGAVSSLARTMVRLAGLYTMADSTQLVFAGALRGAGDTKWVMRASVILHWIFAVVAVVLIRVVRADPVLVWVFFIAFVISMGVTMYLRFRSGKWQEFRLI